MFSEPASTRADDARPSASNDVAFSQQTGAMQAPMVVNEIAEGCLYSGFFGRLDSARMKAVTDRLLDSIQHSACETIIIDLSNIDVIDSMVAAHLMKVGDTLKMIGVRSVFCGISPIVAQTMISTGVSFDRFTVVRNLKAALRLVLRYDGVSLDREP